jgi:hypothetical protein
LHDAEFKDVLQNCRDGRTQKKFILNDGFVFRANKLCIRDSSVHLLLLEEVMRTDSWNMMILPI